VAGLLCLISGLIAGWHDYRVWTGRAERLALIIIPFPGHQGGARTIAPRRERSYPMSTPYDPDRTQATPASQAPTETTAAVPGPDHGQSALVNKWQANAMHPEKALFQIWALLALGIVIRVITPMLATGGIMVISGTAVLLILIGPAVLAGTTLYYNKNLKDAGRALLIGSAAVTTAFGIYLLAWAVS
jgi:hypothetical protein